MRITGTIIALDIATRTGVAWGAPGEAPQSAMVALKKPDEGQDVAFANMIAFLDMKIQELRPQFVFKEAALPLEAFKILGSSESNVRLQYGLHSVVEGVCIRHGVGWDERSESTIRKHFLGVPKLGERAATKAAVVKRCQLLKILPPEVDDDNRADALAAHDFACATFGGRAASITNFQLFEQPGARA